MSYDRPIVDALKVEDLGTASNNTSLVLSPDGVGGVAFVSVPVGNGSLNLSIITTSSANYTVLSTDFTILCDASLNDVELGLPTVASSTGRVLVVKLVNATNTAIIMPAGAELVDGVDFTNPQTLINLYDSVTIQCDGSNWYII